MPKRTEHGSAAIEMMTARVPKTLLARLSMAARQAGRTRSDFLRAIIAKALDETAAEAQ